MKDYQEKVCRHWFMRKSGKRWIFGCALVALSSFVLGMGNASADEVGTVTVNHVENVADMGAVTQDSESQTASASTGKTEKTGSEGTPSASLSSEAEEKKADTASSGRVETAISEEKVEKTETTDLGQTGQTVPQDNKQSEVKDQVQNKTEQADSTAITKSLNVTAQTGFKTNLKDVKPDSSATWKERSDGLYSDARGKGDSFFYSQSRGKNFIYSTDVTFLKKEGAAALVFRSNNNPDKKNSYAVNIDGSSNNVKFWRWQDGHDYQFINEKHIEPTADNKYQLKVVAIGSRVFYYVNNVLVASTGDYTLQRDDKGQSTAITEGYFGLLNWNGELLFQNTYYKEITDQLNPTLNDVTVTSSKGTVEKKGQFTAPITIQYVKHDAETIDLEISPKNANAKITVTDTTGHVYNDFKNIPLKVGANILSIKSSIVDEDGQEISIFYRLNVHRRQADEVYYNELYRGQYHYSVKDGWANDPNGLVYYKGTYHFFYQFYDDTKWGPMHWGHATSKDLLHWKEEPIAFYPDENGAMFSGAIVADTTNSSGLFDDDKGGLVALITADGNGQRIKLAYSKDEGKTWTKVDKIAADWTNDPLQSTDFRDPKVFRWENKWFMVIAGGPLRIYSSDNLREWNVESTYPNLHTECPDLYPLKANDGTLKWVLSRGGRSYKVGDFKKVNGKWTFVPDAAFENQDQVMNFGKDSYAAMTYYVQDFGSQAKPTLPDIVAVNWMNTWEDYCNLVGDTVGQRFNGTFNLNLKMSLVQQDGSYRLVQTPIDAYKNLRETDKAIFLKDVTVAQENNLLKGFKGDQYEIVSTFRPSATTKKIGFNLRVGNGEVTRVVYDLEKETLSIDRSKSGVILSQKFAQVDSQSVKRNADGSIDLHIYVDRSSVEVFAKGNTVAGANQIFPAPSSLAVQVFSEGGNAKADIALYPLKSIWTDKVKATKPLELVQASPTVSNLYVGDHTDLKAYVMPAVASQEVTWTVSDPSLVSVKAEGNTLHVTALKRGTAKIRVASKEKPELFKEFTIEITRNDFKTNVEGLTSVSGKWHVDGESLYNKNTSANDYYMGNKKILYPEYDLDVDIKYQKGLINVFYASENVDPRNAYSIQFGDNDKVRLYRFMGDTIAEANMNGKKLNDEEFHHVKIHKTKNSVTVFVDGVEYLKHTFDTVDPYYNDAYVGLGLWDGDLEVRNLFVKNLNDSVADKKQLQTLVDSTTKIDPKQYTQESVAFYQNALTQAKQVLANQTADQTMIDLATQNLNKAIKGLVAKPSHQVTPNEGVKNLVEEKLFLEVVKEVIAFQTQLRENPSLAKGQRRVVVEGKNGERMILTEVSGEGRKVVEDSIMVQPTNEIVEIGTKEVKPDSPHRLVPTDGQPSHQVMNSVQPLRVAHPEEETLPRTGSHEDSLLTLLGLATLGLGGGLAVNKRKKND